MSRRGNGEGTITHRKDGRWQARLMLPDGKRKSFYGKTRAEVAKKLTEASHTLQKGLPVVEERWTVKKFLLEEWLPKKQHSVRPSTWQRYHDLVHLHLVPEVGKVILAHLTPRQVQALYTRKLGEPQQSGKRLSPTTVHHLHTVLHSALEDALRLGMVGRNVAALVDPPRIQRREMAVFSAAEATAFLEALAEDRLEALYILAITTGMRQGELLALHWQDVDLDAGALTVNATLRYRHGQFEFQPPKTARSRRSIKLAPLAVEALKAHRARQDEERLALGAVWHGAEKRSHDLVFSTALGGPLEGTNILKGFYLRLEKAGLSRIRFHDLRHTFATLQLKANIHPKIVSSMLGHSTIAITLDTYSHVTPDMQEAAAQVMEQVLRKRQG